MLKTLKFSGNERNFFFISDLHQHHDRDFLFGKRGHKNIEDHDLANIQNWNSVCDFQSVCFHLGDLIFNDGTGEKFWKLLDRLNFAELYLLLGNHVSGHRQAYLKILQEQFPSAIEEINNQRNLKYEVYPLTHEINPQKKIVFLPQYAEIQINSTLITLNHYAQEVWNKNNKLALHFHGHSHNSLPDDPNKLRLDVGVERYGRPVMLKELKLELSNKTFQPVDHHDSNTT